MIKIAVDAMGSDLGSSIVVEAIIKFLNDYKDVELVVVGKDNELEKLKNIERVEIVNSTQVMGMEDGALEIMRKKETSMIKAINLVNEKDLDGIVSAGSTGAFLTASTIFLKLMDKVQRAALISPFPKANGDKVILLDIGANNENTSEQIVQFAKMGEVFTKIYKDKEDINLYLLSNGAEDKKGTPEIKEANKMLREINMPSFKGNIEARDVLNTDSDVVITGGFAGNVFLKASEGTASMFSKLLKKAFKRNIFSIIGYLFLRGSINKMQSSLNYKNYGGALLLGVNKVVVKAHGSSDGLSFYHALRLTREIVNNNIINKMRENL